MSDVTMKLNMDRYLLLALEEDITSEDVSANAVMNRPCLGEVELICKQSGVLAGLQVFSRVFELLDERFTMESFCADGDRVEPGQRLARLRGDIRALLSGERTALNFLQRMSGIATHTAELVSLLQGSGITLLDTRKTTPNLRIFEKYAVTVGGGTNHRYNLSDGVMLKDNHIGAAGGIKPAVARARAYAPFVRKIEVETETLEQVREAVEAGADIIMLDNMDPETMKEAVALIAGRAQTECSGNVTAEKIAQLRDIGVDYISSGALTHSSPILDLSLKHLRPVEA
ncbi:carboxylating nicotinate-nucleotide diphosphorylase [bacterium 210917-DFI.7.65]|nr:carboxylating nicotinate-nucleotide diphosphorylase [bacterium 210917-DFI.7.65]